MCCVCLGSLHFCIFINFQGDHHSCNSEIVSVCAWVCVSVCAWVCVSVCAWVCVSVWGVFVCVLGDCFPCVINLSYM